MTSKHSLFPITDGEYGEHLFKFVSLPLRTISSVHCPLHGLDEVVSAVSFPAFHALGVSIRSRTDNFLDLFFACSTGDPLVWSLSPCCTEAFSFP